MRLTEEQVVANNTRYFETAEKYGFTNDMFMNFLGVDFIKAPASTATNLHNAFTGGLVAHLLAVAKFAYKINETLPSNMKVDDTSLIKVCLLHQVGKAELYTPKESKWHNDRGIMYEFNEDLTSFKVGERSAFYAMSNGIMLSEDEYQAIINHDKTDDDKQAKWHSSMLGVILKQANELAIMSEKLSV